MAKLKFWDGNKLHAIPVPGMRTEGRVFHYTNGAGLLGIVQSSSLWASSPLSLNDLTEIEYGTNMARDIWGSWPGTLSPEQKNLGEAVFGADGPNPSHHVPLYLLCACSSGDSLNQWRNYAGGQGFAIGFDLAKSLAVYASERQPGHLVGPAVLNGWYDVVYAEEEQRAHLADLFAFVLQKVRDEPHLVDGLSSVLAIGILNLAAQFKHPAYQSEEEVRYIAFGQPLIPEQFRVGPFGIVPYLHLTGAETYKFYVPIKSPLPLTQIGIGPVNDQEGALLLRATKRLLAANNYDVDVSISDVPFRHSARL